MRALFSSLLLACLTSPILAAEAPRPNIIFILADDLGYGDLACYGGRVIQTPRIDQMRAEGLKLTQHYSGSCMCAPTRSAFLTGQHTGHTRIRNNGSHLRKSNPALLPEDVTVAEVLKKAGYATGVIGKWGCGESGTTGVPLAQGFDHWFGYLNQTNAHHYYPPFLWRGPSQEDFPSNPELRLHYSHDLFTEDAVHFIQEHAGSASPFFLYLAYTIPHVDLDVPEDSKTPYIGVIEETKPYGTPGGQHYRYEERPHATFAGMVSRMDRDVGHLLDVLRELDIDKNTLVIFTSDNGPTSAGGADPKFFDGNGPLRGIKFELYEGGIRCPFIAWWPGTISAGTESHHISAQWDMLPTFADLAGTTAPEGVDGLSMAPLLTGHADSQPSHDHLYWEAYNSGGQQAVRRGPWKAVRQGVVKNPDQPVQLYHLENDLAETTDVAASHPDVVAEMLQLMRTDHIPNEDYDWKPGARKKGSSGK